MNLLSRLEDRPKLLRGVQVLAPMPVLSKWGETLMIYGGKSLSFRCVSVVGWYVAVPLASKWEESSPMNVWGGADLLAALDLLFPDHKTVLHGCGNEPRELNPFKREERIPGLLEPNLAMCIIV